MIIESFAFLLLLLGFNMINHKASLQIASVTAILGITIVIFNTLLNLWGLPVYVLGFALMFLGTLWRAVLEMNSEDQ